MSHTGYSEKFKLEAMKKAFSPDRYKSYKILSNDLGIPYSTLMKWKSEYSQSPMSKNKKKEFSAEEKLEALNKKFSFSETEFGEFLRSKGILSTDVEAWRAEFLNSAKASLRGPGRPKKDPELQKLKKDFKALEKDLNRKDRALAEMSARVILIKKSQKLFGMMDSEDEG